MAGADAARAVEGDGVGQAAAAFGGGGEHGFGIRLAAGHGVGAPGCEAEIFQLRGGGGGRGDLGAARRQW